MKRQSFITGECYDTNDVCHIVNMNQLAAYLENDIKLLDLFTSRDRESNKPILVGVVGKKDSYEAYKAWCDHKLN